MPAVQLSPQTIVHPLNGQGLILDLERGRFFGLDKIALELLTSLMAHNVNTSATQIATRYGVKREQVVEDCRRFVDSLCQHDLMETGDDQVRPAETLRNPVRSASLKVLRLIAGLCLKMVSHNSEVLRLPPLVLFVLSRLVWLTLRMYGWRSSLLFWADLCVGDLTSVVHDSVVASVDNAVQKMGSRSLLFPMECKERAILGHVLFHKIGIASNLIIGVQNAPFMAHAWVEVDGRIVTDDPGHCALFEPAAAYVGHSTIPVPIG